MACFLPLYMVSRQCELDSTIFLPAPADPGKSATDTRQEEEDLGQDDDTGQKQREREGGRQVELVAALLEGTGPAIGERVQGAQHQRHEA